MSPVVDCATDLAMGWALTSSSKKARFSKKQKDYLIGNSKLVKETVRKQILAYQRKNACLRRVMMKMMKTLTIWKTQQWKPKPNCSPTKLPANWYHSTICVISYQGLKKFNISVLKEICDSLMIDATDVSAKRKQPYIEKIEEFCTGCTCRG